MTSVNAIALFGTLFVLAVLPSTSALMVMARTSASGILHGALTITGIITGDIIFIFIAIIGLTFIADVMGDLFIFIQYLSGAYLLWLGSHLLRPSSTDKRSSHASGSSLAASYIGGLLITLADQKAILFYFGLFPAFLSRTETDVSAMVTILIIATTSIACAKACYIYAAIKARSLTQHRFQQRLNTLAAYTLIIIGIYLILSNLLQQLG